MRSYEKLYLLIDTTGYNYVLDRVYKFITLTANIVLVGGLWPNLKSKKKTRQRKREGPRHVTFTLRQAN